jgi:predicted nucleic acid-binding Zn ribbon protein
MSRRHGDHPEPLDRLLDQLAQRWRRVDVRLIDHVRELWPAVVDPVLATSCRPEFIKDRVLLVSAPSGAFAQRVIQETPAIVAALAVLGEQAPTSVRVRVGVVETGD